MNKIIMILLAIISISFLINGLYYSGSQYYISQDSNFNVQVFPMEKVNLEMFSDYNSTVNVSIDGQNHSLRRGESLCFVIPSGNDSLNIQTYNGLFTILITVHPDPLLKDLYEFSGGIVLLILASYVLWSFYGLRLRSFHP